MQRRHVVPDGRDVRDSVSNGSPAEGLPVIAIDERRSELDRLQGIIDLKQHEIELARALIVKQHELLEGGV